MKITHSSFIKLIQRDYGQSFLEILQKRTFSDFLKTIDNISDSAVGIFLAFLFFSNWKRLNAGHENIPLYFYCV